MQFTFDRLKCTVKVTGDRSSPVEKGGRFGNWLAPHSHKNLQSTETRNILRGNTTFKD